MDLAIIKMLLRRIMMIHKYRQILFYSVLVFLFILSCSMRSDPDMEQPDSRHSGEQRSDTSENLERTGEQRSHTSEDTEETGSGNGGGFHYDRASDHQDDDDLTDDDEVDAGLTPVLDTRGPSHGFWPEDTQCSRHR